MKNDFKEVFLMPRNVYKFPEEQGLKNYKNIEHYKDFVKNYVLNRMGSGQFVNCKILQTINGGKYAILVEKLNFIKAL